MRGFADRLEVDTRWPGRHRRPEDQQAPAHGPRPSGTRSWGSTSWRSITGRSTIGCGEQAVSGRRRAGAAAALDPRQGEGDGPAAAAARRRGMDAHRASTASRGRGHPHRGVPRRLPGTTARTAPSPNCVRPRARERCWHDDILRSPAIDSSRGPAAMMGAEARPDAGAVAGDHRRPRACGRDRGCRLGQDDTHGCAGRLPGGDRTGCPGPGARTHLHHEGRGTAQSRHRRCPRRVGAASSARHCGGRRHRRAHGGHLQLLRVRARPRARPADRPRAQRAVAERRWATPTRSAGRLATPGPGRVALGEREHGRRAGARARRPAQRAPVRTVAGTGFPGAASCRVPRAAAECRRRPAASCSPTISTS